MFISAEIRLGIGFDAARDKLADLVRGGLLGRASGGAYDQWQAGLARVRPRGMMLGMYRIARVRVTEMVTRADSALWPMRWEVTGSGDTLVPALDAEIKLIPAGEDTTVLTVSGVCRPLLARQVAGLDPTAAHEVAQAAIQAFTSRIATDIADPDTPGLEVDGAAGGGSNRMVLRDPGAGEFKAPVVTGAVSAWLARPPSGQVTGNSREETTATWRWR
jgi:hypothetical protein